MNDYDNLPKDFREIIQEYGIWGIRALRNAKFNNTPIERVKLELEYLKLNNRI